ncbi:hypothetical protein RJT34_20224 [Clitoria ternatea]|uniref:Uncharacterized protein n=1 Tax=Clitoria ternatea TaxID=43366 RepID=A0AAN9IST7_CLITE
MANRWVVGSARAEDWCKPHRPRPEGFESLSTYARNDLIGMSKGISSRFSSPSMGIYSGVDVSAGALRLGLGYPMQLPAEWVVE